MWRVLHGSAFRVRDSRPGHLALAALIVTLPEVMPCSLCRESFAGLLRRGEVETPEKLASRMAKDGCEEVVFLLHNAVNDKLGRVGGPTLEQVHMVAAAREAALQPYFSVGDLWFMLYLFAGCADVVPGPECPQRRLQVCAFIDRLVQVLRQAAMLPDVCDRLAAVFGGCSRTKLANESIGALVADAIGVHRDVPKTVARIARVDHADHA